MLAATAKIGSKNFIHVDVLQAIRSQLEQLPAKQKTMLEFRDAVAFLYPGLKGAVQKNYSKDEILQVIVKAGWEITHNSFRYLWSLFLSEDETSCKRKSAPKSAGKERRETTRNTARKINSNASPTTDASFEPLQDNSDAGQLEQHSITEAKTPANIESLTENNEANTATHNSAHFVLPPDSDDL